MHSIHTFEIGGDGVARFIVDEAVPKALEGVTVGDHSFDVKVIVLCAVCLFCLDGDQSQQQ